MKLTERIIEKLELPSGKRERMVFDDEQRGLGVRVTPSGRSYLVQYTLNGRKGRVPLGACKAISLRQARQAAAGVMGDVANSKNPAQDRKNARAAAKVARQALSLDQLISEWERLHLSDRRIRYASEAPRALRLALAKYLKHPAEDLTKAMVVRALDARITKNGEDGISGPNRGTYIADRTAAYGKALYGWAGRRGTIGHNPFDRLPKRGSAKSRDRVLTDHELASILKALRHVSQPYREIVMILALTGKRRDEVAGMAWKELSSDLSTWTLPADREKNSAPHIVPLSDGVQRLIRSRLPEHKQGFETAVQVLAQTEDLVFPGKRKSIFSGWSKSKRELDSASGVINWRLHDIRRTVATGLQSLGIRLEVTEAVLNHTSGSRAGIAGVYQRHDWATEKRLALERWAAVVEGMLCSEMTKPNVINGNFGGSVGKTISRKRRISQ